MGATVAHVPSPTLLADERVPPTVVDAQRVADAFAEDPNVVQVLLYGSVARGTQGRFSDIDLVVVHADIDYRQRESVGIELVEAGELLVNARVDVHATDLPEWSIRKNLVANSFEADLNRLPLVPLVDRPVDVSAVDWGKEQIMPTDNLSNAVDALYVGVGDQLKFLASQVRVHEAELEEERLDRRGRAARLIHTTTLAALALELSIKALAMLLDGKCITEARLAKAGHAIDECLGLLGEPYRRLFTGLLVVHGIKVTDVQKFRSSPYDRFKSSEDPLPKDVPSELEVIADEQVDRYLAVLLSVSDAVIDEFKQRVESRTPEQLTAAALAVADVVIDEFEFVANGDAKVARARGRWENLRRAYETFDVRTGEKREVPLDLTPMLEAQRRRVREALSATTDAQDDATGSGS